MSDELTLRQRLTVQGNKFSYDELCRLSNELETERQELRKRFDLPEQKELLERIDSDLAELGRQIAAHERVLNKR